MNGSYVKADDPRELEEWRGIDGARLAGHAYIVITVGDTRHPLGGIFAFTLSWNESFYASSSLSSPEQKTVPVGVHRK